MILISFLIAPKVFAKSNNDEIRKVEYSEDFKRWLKLSDEEKNKTIQPRMYDVIVTDFNTRNVFYKVRLLGAKSNSKYNTRKFINKRSTANEFVLDVCGINIIRNKFSFI